MRYARIFLWSNFNTNIELNSTRIKLYRQHSEFIKALDLLIHSISNYTAEIMANRKVESDDK